MVIQNKSLLLKGKYLSRLVSREFDKALRLGPRDVDGQSLLTGISHFSKVGR